jgi:hypothetical protein
LTASTSFPVVRRHGKGKGARGSGGRSDLLRLGRTRRWRRGEHGGRRRRRSKDRLGKRVGGRAGLEEVWEYLNSQLSYIWTSPGPLGNTRALLAGATPPVSPAPTPSHPPSDIRKLTIAPQGARRGVQTMATACR